MGSRANEIKDLQDFLIDLCLHFPDFRDDYMNVAPSPPAEREETMTRSNVDNTSEDLQPSDSNIKPQDNMLSSMPATTRTLFWFSIHDNTQCFNIQCHDFSATNRRLECYVSRLRAKQLRLTVM